MTAKNFFTNPITIIVGSVLILIGLGWVGKKYWGWFQDNTERKSGGCNTDADCPKPGTHCGEEKICVYNLEPERELVETKIIIRPRPTPHPTPNPDGGPKPNPDAVI